MFPGATDITTKPVIKIVITTIVSKTVLMRKNNEICKRNCVVRKLSAHNVSTTTLFIPYIWNYKEDIYFF